MASPFYSVLAQNSDVASIRELIPYLAMGYNSVYTPARGLGKDNMCGAYALTTSINAILNLPEGDRVRFEEVLATQNTDEYKEIVKSKYSDNPALKKFVLETFDLDNDFDFQQLALFLEILMRQRNKKFRFGYIVDNSHSKPRFLQATISMEEQTKTMTQDWPVVWLNYDQGNGGGNHWEGVARTKISGRDHKSRQGILTRFHKIDADVNQAIQNGIWQATDDIDSNHCLEFPDAIAGDTRAQSIFLTAVPGQFFYQMTTEPDLTKWIMPSNLQAMHEQWVWVHLTRWNGDANIRDGTVGLLPRKRLRKIGITNWKEAVFANALPPAEEIRTPKNVRAPKAPAIEHQKTEPSKLKVRKAEAPAKSHARRTEGKKATASLWKALAQQAQSSSLESATNVVPTGGPMFYRSHVEIQRDNPLEVPVVPQFGDNNAILLHRMNDPSSLVLARDIVGNEALAESTDLTVLPNTWGLTENDVLVLCDLDTAYPIVVEESEAKILFRQRLTNAGIEDPGETADIRTLQTLLQVHAEDALGRSDALHMFRTNAHGTSGSRIQDEVVHAYRNTMSLDENGCYIITNFKGESVPLSKQFIVKDSDIVHPFGIRWIRNEPIPLADSQANSKQRTQVSERLQHDAENFLIDVCFQCGVISSDEMFPFLENSATRRKKTQFDNEEQRNACLAKLESLLLPLGQLWEDKTWIQEVQSLRLIAAENLRSQCREIGFSYLQGTPGEKPSAASPEELIRRWMARKAILSVKTIKPSLPESRKRKRGKESSFEAKK